MALRLAAAVAQRPAAGHEPAEKHDAGGPAVRQAASRLAADGTARHRQGDARLAFRPLPAGRPGRAACSAAAPDTLDVAPDAPGRALVDARTHPDLFHLRRTLIPRRPHPDEITIDDVRGAQRVHAHDAGDGRLAGRHRRRGRRDEPQQRQRDAEGPRGAAAQRRAADRRPCAGAAAADHPLALPPARPAAARRRDRDRPAGRLRAEHGAGREEVARAPRRRQHRARARARRAPAASGSTARWSRCWRRCPSSTCRACMASPKNSHGAARRPMPTGARSITCSTAG